MASYLYLSLGVFILNESMFYSLGLFACLLVLFSIYAKALVINGCPIVTWAYCHSVNLDYTDLSGADLSNIYGYCKVQSAKCKVQSAKCKVQTLRMEFILSQLSFRGVWTQ